jgi:hypothetical protein
MPGFSTNLAPSKKANSLPDDVPIYYHGGHGEDLCDPITHELRIDTVPENCIYITVGECGRVTQSDRINRFLTLFRDPSEKARTLLRFPYLFENLIEISKQTGFSKENFHVHLPGSKYVVSKITPPLSWNNEHFGMLFSGITEKSRIERVSKDVFSHVTIKDNDIGESKCLATLNELEETKGLFQKLQRTCRSDYDVSRLLAGRKAEGLLNRMFVGKDTVTKDEIMLFLNKVGNGMTTDNFLGLFEASVFPTQSDVRTMVRENTAGLEDGYLYSFDIDTVAKIIKHAYPENKYLVSEIMREYPGIHYNIVCRVVSDDCFISAPSIRRIISHEAEQIRRNPDKIIMSSPESFITERDKLMSSNKKKDIDEILNFIKANRDYIVVLPITEVKELLYNISNILDDDLKGEKGPDTLIAIYGLLYPINDSYSLKQMEYAIERDKELLGTVYSYTNSAKHASAYDILDPFLSSRVKDYIRRTNKKSAKNISKIEQNELFSNIYYYLKDNANAISSFNKLFIPDPDPVRLPVNRSRQRPSQNQSRGKEKGSKFSSLYTTLVARVDGILIRDYPKAKDEHNLLYIKQGAIFNTLRGMKDSIARLSNEEKKAFITYLVSKQIVSIDADDSMISKRIKYSIMPEVYPNPQAGGKRRTSTRKITKQKAKRMTRKK